jgi:Domain of unknown function (DUF5615)
MALKLYMDHHVPRAITIGLRMRSVDVITAHEDGAGSLSDSDLLDRAGKLGRVLFTHDDDLVVEAVRRQRDAIPFSGVIYAHQLRTSIGRCIQDLELIASASESEDMANRIEFLPL